MKVRGDLPPNNAFSLEPQPKKHGFVLARFYEGVVPFEETIDGLTIKGYEYNEYHLELIDTGDLYSDILNRYDFYMSMAKLQENDDTPVDDIEAIKEHLANVTLALEIVLGVYDDEL